MVPRGIYYMLLSNISILVYKLKKLKLNRVENGSRLTYFKIVKKSDYVIRKIRSAMSTASTLKDLLLHLHIIDRNSVKVPP